MKTNNREILIYYNPESNADKKTVAFARSVSPHIRTYAFNQNPSTNTSWQMILLSLGKEPKELLNKAHPFYQKNLRGKEFDREDWLKVLLHNPELIKAPVAVRGNKAILCNNPTDIYRLTA